MVKYPAPCQLGELPEVEASPPAEAPEEADEEVSGEEAESRADGPAARPGDLPNLPLAKGVSLRTCRLVCGLALISLLGCQTSLSWDEGCPGAYSGVRYFWDQVDALPFDGKLFYILDLPLTSVADTILLPVSVFMEPTRPRLGFAPGCTWAAKR